MVRICTYWQAMLLFSAFGFAVLAAACAGIDAMNRTATFLGSESDWDKVRIELNYMHGLYGISNVYITGSGNVICQTARYIGGELSEKRYVLALEKAEVHRLIESFITNDFVSIRVEDREGIPDEGKPDITLANPQGQKTTKSVWTGIEYFKEKKSKEAARRFSKIHDEIIKIQRQAEERREPIYSGKYRQGSWGEAKNSVSAGEYGSPMVDLFRLEMAGAVSHETARSYQRSAQLEFLVSGRIDGQGDTAKIVLSGKLLNPTTSELPVIMYPEDGISPFYAYIIADSRIALKPRDNLLRQVPSYRKPEPLHILVPAGRQIVFLRDINLTDYIYRGSPEAQVYWRFNYWDKQIEGKITLQLPQTP